MYLDGILNWGLQICCHDLFIHVRLSVAFYSFVYECACCSCEFLLIKFYCFRIMFAQISNYQLLYLALYLCNHSCCVVLWILLN